MAGRSWSLMVISGPTTSCSTFNSCSAISFAKNFSVFPTKTMKVLIKGELRSLSYNIKISLPHSYKMYFRILSSSSKLLASHIASPSVYSGSFLSLFSLAAGSCPCVLPAPVVILLLTSCKALRRCSTFRSAVCNSSLKVSPLPDLYINRTNFLFV